MSDLIVQIARTLAEFDRKDWDNLLDDERTPYAARAIMIAYVVREQSKDHELHPDPVIEIEGLRDLTRPDSLAGGALPL
jgi:hypothetical protein